MNATRIDLAGAIAPSTACQIQSGYPNQGGHAPERTRRWVSECDKVPRRSMLNRSAVPIVNKQLNDKERVQAALENTHLLGVVEGCLSTANQRGGSVPKA